MQQSACLRNYFHSGSLNSFSFFYCYYEELHQQEHRLIYRLIICGKASSIIYTVDLCIIEFIIIFDHLIIPFFSIMTNGTSRI